jgi:hypothetical protein
VNAVIPEVIPADVHQPDEVTFIGVRNRKYACKTWAVELPIVLLAGDLPPALSIRRRLNEPRFQMGLA